ncbi:MAG: hypothetical protein C5B51_29185 [Terriglobia bacterium]|nr:MAG: hypothetical protein C5B51_29185 [Terriglobia bacterium]
MTPEERFERIEYVTAGPADQLKKDTEENRLLWRDTQRQLHELSTAVTRFVEASLARDQRLGERIEHFEERIEQYAAESRAADHRLETRIDALVSAIGALTLKMKD